jgi:nucleotide-binding universal stress UspA family protein
MNGSPARGIVVAIDGSPNAQDALDWAAAEAALRRVPLHIVHSWHLTPRRLPPRIVSDVSTPVVQAARGLLKEAENWVREQHSDVEVDCELLPEETVPGLIHRSEQAELLVVGSRGRNRLASTLLGSVSQQLVAHSPCPVIVLREHRAGHHLSASRLGTITTTAPVVLGVAPGEMAAPVEFAFAEASRRGVPLRAIRTWLYPQAYPGVITLPRLEEDQRNREESADLAEILAPSHKSFPDVQVTPVTGLDEADAALVDASAGAGLLVVGATRTRHHLAPAIGPITQRVLHHAHCPIAVVPHA